MDGRWHDERNHYRSFYPMFAFNVGLDIVTLNDVNHEHLSYKQHDFYPIHLILTVVGYYYFNIYI